MQLNHHITKAFVRAALYNSGSGAYVSDPATAVAELMGIVEGKFTSATTNGMVLIGSTTSGRTFQFATATDLSRTQILAYAEAALEIIERYIDSNAARPVAEQLSNSQLVARIRIQELRTRKRSRADFSTRNL